MMMMVKIMVEEDSHLGSLEKTLAEGVYPFHPPKPLSTSFPGHALVLGNGPHPFLGQLPIARTNLVELPKQAVHLCLDGNHRQPPPDLSNTDPKLLVTARPASL